MILTTESFASGEAHADSSSPHPFNNSKTVNNHKAGGRFLLSASSYCSSRPICHVLNLAATCSWNDRKKKIIRTITVGMQGRPATEHGARPVTRIVMQERPASRQLILEVRQV